VEIVLGFLWDTTFHRSYTASLRVRRNMHTEWCMLRVSALKEVFKLRGDRLTAWAVCSGHAEWSKGRSACNDNSAAHSRSSTIAPIRSKPELVRGGGGACVLFVLLPLCMYSPLYLIVLTFPISMPFGLIHQISPGR
jgi:hypothetical protein